MNFSFGNGWTVARNVSSVITLFTEYPGLADDVPSDKNVESLRNVINIAISDIHTK